MLYANYEGHVHAKATAELRGARGTCPGCRSEVLCKGVGGDGRPEPYWSHTRDSDCDTWYDARNAMSAWHRGWQSLVVEAAQEVVLREGDVHHRADIVGTGGTIVEVQHSPIPIEAVREREAFYGRHGGLVWIFDGGPSIERITWVSRGVLRWRRAPTSIIGAQARVYLDLEAGLVEKPATLGMPARAPALLRSMPRAPGGTLFEVERFDGDLVHGRWVSRLEFYYRHFLDVLAREMDKVDARLENLGMVRARLDGVRRRYDGIVGLLRAREAREARELAARQRAALEAKERARQAPVEAPGPARVGMSPQQWREEFLARFPPAHAPTLTPILPAVTIDDRLHNERWRKMTLPHANRECWLVGSDRVNPALCQTCFRDPPGRETAQLIHRA